MARDVVSVAGTGTAPDPARARVGASRRVRPCLLLRGEPRSSRADSPRGAFDYKAFLLPMAIAFAVTGMSRAPTLVTDIQSGYFDRLCMTPIRRPALLLGLMAADVVVIIALCVPVLAIGFGVGVRFHSGVAGVLAFVAFSAAVGSRLHGLPLRGCAEDRQPGSRATRLSSCSSRSSS